MRNFFPSIIRLMPITGLLLLTACGSVRPVDSNRVDMGSYSVAVPPGFTVEPPMAGSWLGDLDLAKKMVRLWWVIRSGAASGATVITVYEDVVPDEEERIPENQMANTYRSEVERRLKEESFRRNDYEVQDMTRDVTTVGQKTLYTIRFKRKWKNGYHEKAIFYLYFPPDFGEKGTVYCFMVSFLGGPISLGGPYEGHVRRVIESLEIRP
jgi:hypothetical protein